MRTVVTFVLWAVYLGVLIGYGSLVVVMIQLARDNDKLLQEEYDARCHPPQYKTGCESEFDDLQYRWTGQHFEVTP